jgi:hypothetical protein
MMIREVLFPLFHGMYQHAIGEHERAKELKSRIADFHATE